MSLFSHRHSLSCLAAGLLLGVAVIPVIARDNIAGPAQRYFTDVELVDQQGQTQRLYSDLLQGHTVVVAAFFSSCEASCPMTMAKLKQLQTRFRDRLGRDLRILSLSVDPQTDTPARLSSYAADLDAAPGWYFLSGDPERVRFALRKLGYVQEDKEAHAPVLIIGNEATGLWKKVLAMAPSDELATIVGKVLDDAMNGS